MRQAILIGLFLLGLVVAGSAQAANVWSWDCGSDPTASGPGVVGAWVVRGGGTFDTGKLTTSAIDGSSVWTGNGGTDQIVDTSPLNPFTTLTTVDLRWRATSTTPEHAWFSINIDYSGGTMAPIFAFLSRDSDTSQKLSQKLLVATKSAHNSDLLELFNITGLDDGFIRTQLVLDPNNNTVSLTVNSVNKGAVGYTPFSPQNEDRFASILGSGMEVDYIGINTATPVPAPAGLALLGLGSMGLAFIRRRKAQKA